jgi:hypothetical protein
MSENRRAVAPAGGTQPIAAISACAMGQERQ